MVILFGCLAIALAAFQGGSSSEVKGRILRIGTNPDGLGEDPVLTVELTDGTIQTVLTTAPNIIGCDVGSEVVLIKRRLRYSASPLGC